MNVIKKSNDQDRNSDTDIMSRQQINTFDLRNTSFNVNLLSEEDESEKDDEQMTILDIPERKLDMSKK